jgi:hypothetical protein
VDNHGDPWKPAVNTAPLPIRVRCLWVQVRVQKNTPMCYPCHTLHKDDGPDTKDNDTEEDQDQGNWDGEDNKDDNSRDDRNDRHQDWPGMKGMTRSKQ